MKQILKKPKNICLKTNLKTLLMKNKAVIFDLDGVLIDSKKYVLAWSQVKKKLALRNLSKNISIYRFTL